MAFRPVEFHLKNQRGTMTLEARGRTDRGQRFIVGSVDLQVTDTGDPLIKMEIAAAVEDLYPADAPTPA